MASEPPEQSSSNETTSTGGAVTTISTLVSDGEALTEFYSEGEIVERIGPNMLKEIEASRENITQLLGIPKTTVTTLKSNTSDSSTGSGDSQSSTSCMADDEEMSSEQISIGEVDPSSRMKSSKPQLKYSRAKATETSKTEENTNSKSGRNQDLPNKDPTTLLKTKKKKEILQRLKLLRDSEDDLSKSLTSTKDSFSIGQHRDEGEHSIGEVPPGYSLSEGEIVPQRAPAVKTVRREDQTSEGELSGMLSPGEVQTETKTKQREQGLKTSMSAESVRRVIAVQPPLNEHSFLLSSPHKGKEKVIASDNSAENDNMSKSDPSQSSSEKISSVLVKSADESPVKSLVPDVSFLEVATTPQIHIPLDIAGPDSFFNAPKNGQASSSTTAWQLPDLKSASPIVLSEQFQSNVGKDKVTTNVSLLHDVEMSSTSFVSPHHPASSSHPMLPLPTFTTPSRKGPSHLSGDLDETIEIEEVSEVKYEDPRSLLSAISQFSSPVSVSSTSRSIGEIGLERLKSPTPLRTSVETEKWVESLSQVLDSSFRKSEFRTRASANEEKRSEHSSKDENPLGESYLNLGTPSGQLPPVIADNVSHQVPSLISQVHDTEQDKGKLSDRSEISEVLNESVSDYKSASSSEHFETRDEPQRTEDAAGSTSHHARKSFEELTQTIDKVSEIESVSDSIISFGKQSS
ncbi:hypothetical protein BKA69DRAFT_597386 [Paraphysoderma sedebokerense]|nr:hypothetical protein BKA69DRAFT_597386 [Paraphysoderma sedebokerense]